MLQDDSMKLHPSFLQPNPIDKLYLMQDSYFQHWSSKQQQWRHQMASQQLGWYHHDYGDVTMYLRWSHHNYSDLTPATVISPQLKGCHLYYGDIITRLLSLKSKITQNLDKILTIRIKHVKAVTSVTKRKNIIKAACENHRMLLKKLPKVESKLYIINSPCAAEKIDNLFWFLTKNIS